MILFTDPNLKTWNHWQPKDAQGIEMVNHRSIGVKFLVENRQSHWRNYRTTNWSVNLGFLYIECNYLKEIIYPRKFLVENRQSHRRNYRATD